ncbi:MAG: hypothetical protein JSV80_18075, partial [Acidobacteriota bacterium]
RHLRIRPGDTTPEVWDKDAILVLGNEQAPVHHVVVDHVSAQWAIDENIDVHGWAENITFQWCLIAEGSLTGHPKGPHSMGILSGGDPRITVSVHHSLLAHNADRNPRLGGNPNGVNDFRNNVIYNWNNNNASKSSSSARTNFVGNFYIQGPDSSPTSAMGVLIVPDRTNSTGVQLYVDGNWGPPDCFAGCESEWDIGVWYVEDGTKYEADEQLYRIWRPLSAPAVTTHAADVALEIVLENVGATLPRRDAVDQRIVDDVVNGTGAIGIGSDYPGLTSGLWPPDSDHDGMPDAWEATYGLNALDESDSRGDLNGDGYTNIEEFLNDRDPTAPPAAAGAGAVPDGRWVQGEQLVVTKADERRIVLDWAASCRPEDADYAIYEGELPDFASHVPMYCSTGGVSNKTYPPASLNAYVLVVPRRSASEGSYGLDSSGTQRPQAGSACGDQTVLSCP